jgi:hypothetical protein
MNMHTVLGFRAASPIWGVAGGFVFPNRMAVKREIA